MARSSFEMPAICGFVFQDEPISDAVKTALLANPSGDGEIVADDIEPVNVTRLLSAAFIHLKLWKEEKETGPFLEAISQQVRIAPLVVLEVLNFVVGARQESGGLAYYADRIGCEAMSKKTGPFQEWVKNCHEIPAPLPAPAADNNNGAENNGELGNENGGKRTQKSELKVVTTTTTDDATKSEQESRPKAVTRTLCHYYSTTRWEERYGSSANRSF
ncbi:hypothetical protein CHU98_g8968 [Xylaria longipes]|nr:hypothetical protein CHU98_g8968 [Xylaria longipes]